MKLPFGKESHPAADVMPMIPDDELQALADDIRANGLLEPIKLTPDGLVLDGRNRLIACQRAGAEPRYETCAEDPVRYVLSANLARRHVSKWQKCCLTLALVENEPWFVAACSKRGGRDRGDGLAKVHGVRELGRAAGCSHKMASDALLLKRLRPSDFLRASAGGLQYEAALRTLKPGHTAAGRDFYEKRAERQFQAAVKAKDEELSKVQARLGLYENLCAITPPEPVVQRVESGKRLAAAVVLASDWHVEERVRPESVAGLNEYNLEVAQSRIDKLVEGVLWNLELFRSRFEIDQLIFALLGDLITGYHLEEFQRTNELAPLDAIGWLRDVLVSRVFDPILEQAGISELIVPCCYGNHGRMSQKKQIKGGAQDSLEHFLYGTLARHYLTDDRVRFHVAPGDLLYLDIYDLTVRFTHGDMIQYLGGVGGPTISLNKAIDRWDTAKRAHLTCLGHLHQYYTMPRAIGNGSLIGYNEFAQHIKAPYEEPQQAFFLVDAKRGVRYVNQIWTSERGESAEALEDDVPGRQPDELLHGLPGEGD